MSDVYDEKEMIDELEEQSIDDDKPTRKRKATKLQVVEDESEDNSTEDETPKKKHKKVKRKIVKDDSEDESKQDEIPKKKHKQTKRKMLQDESKEDETATKKQRKAKQRIVEDESQDESRTKKQKKATCLLSDISDARRRKLLGKIYKGCKPNPNKPECLVNQKHPQIWIKEVGLHCMKTKLILVDRDNMDIIGNSMILRVCDTQKCFTASHLFVLLPNNHPNKQDRYNNFFGYIKAQCIVDAVTGCWIFTGCTDDEYGVGATAQKKFPEINSNAIHRAMYMLANLDFNIPSEIFIRHDQGSMLCSGYACCNPSHLAKGDDLANKEDDRKNGKILQGEMHPNSKITQAVAQQIKDSKGKGTRAERAKRFNVTPGTVQGIDRNTSWASLPRNGIVEDNVRQRQVRDDNRARCQSKMKNGFSTEEYNCSVKRIEEHVELHSCGDLVGRHGKGKFKDCQLLPKDFHGNIGGCSRTSAYVIMFEHHNNNNIIVRYHPKTRVIRHLCKPLDDQICVEPSHMKLGTAKENSQDKNYWRNKKNENEHL